MKFNREEIIKALESKGAKLPCHRCEHQSFAVIDGFVFSADANGFTQDGTMKIYNVNGAVLKTFNTKVGPNGFYFNI